MAFINTKPGPDTSALIVAVILFIFLFIFVVGYVILIAVSNSKSSKLRRLPKNWDSYTEKVLENAKVRSSFDKPAALPSFGSRTASLRRRLIMSSVKPSHYSSYHGKQILSIGPDDLKSYAQSNKKFERLESVPETTSSKPSSYGPFFDPLHKQYDAQGKEIHRKIIFGYFHPYANAGGGGERVMWAAVKQTLEQSSSHVCAIYTGDTDSSPEQIIQRAKSRFDLDLDSDRVVFIYLNNRKLVDSSLYPHFTLFAQALGSVFVAYEAINILIPDVFVDTMGYPFTYPLISWILDVPICAYVHYPVISSDMIGSLWKGPWISYFNPWILGKTVYWYLFGLAYTFVGSYVSVIATNSTWTNNHMTALWWFAQRPDHIKTVYPPCATKELAAFDIETDRQPIVAYVAQFRPEKRHELVITEFAKFLEKWNQKNETSKDIPSRNHPRLVLIGTIRDDSDKSHVYSLRLLARELHLSDDYLSFILDAPWSQVQDVLSKASIGVNAMWNEHFGMVVVEYMAAGLIPIVHNSGGPKLDIVIQDEEGKPSGFFFVSDDDKDSNAEVSNESVPPLSQALTTVFELPKDEVLGYRQRARSSGQRFSDEAFAESWSHRVNILVKLEQLRRRKRLMKGYYD